MKFSVQAANAEKKSYISSIYLLQLVTSLIFLDASGAPWPIKAYDIGDQDTTMEIAHCSNYMDSPNTTSAVTYQLQVKNHEGGTGTYYYNRNVRDDNANHSERGLSWVTAMEVASGVL